MKKIITKIKYAARGLVVPFRSILMRVIKPKANYLLFSSDPKRMLEPISNKNGFDRGTPIDRFYIEKFMNENSDNLKGRCLEVHDNAYTKRYGGSNITQSDVLDIDTNNGFANIYGDLRNLNTIADNTYDSIILTHTVGAIDDIWSVIKEIHRILIPGGKLLFTASSGIKPQWHPENVYWRMSAAMIKYIFGKYYDLNMIKIKTYGNVLVCQAFLVGLAAEELTAEELEYNDQHFPLIITAVVTK